MSNQKSNRGFGGRGYYIALILCAAAIGISGYVYYRSTPGDTPAVSVDEPVVATDQVSVLDGTTGPQADLPPAKATDPTNATQPTKLATCAPVAGDVIAPYAMECLSYNQTTRDWRTHNGVDFGAEAGTEVVAAAAGEVYTVYDDDELGTTVVICHDGGYITRYSSLDADVPVSPGDAVAMGQVIGCVGSTAMMESALGDHLHFSVTCDSEPVDPMEFIGD